MSIFSDLIQNDKKSSSRIFFEMVVLYALTRKSAISSAKYESKLNNVPSVSFNKDILNSSQKFAKYSFRTLTMSLCALTCIQTAYFCIHSNATGYYQITNDGSSSKKLFFEHFQKDKKTFQVAIDW
ncbi:hypothetical protein ABPG72_020591 [Tetrahymena utriculariae]